MRTISAFVATALLLGTGPALAQQAAPFPASGVVDFGVRMTGVSGDAARFQRFRDTGDGAILERVRLERQGAGWFLEAGADHAGRRDQRFFAAYRSAGTLKLSFQWDQIPLFISADTRTPYTTASPGVLRLPDAVRGAVQAGQAGLVDVARLAQPFDAESRRDVALFDLLFRATPALDVTLNVKSTHREGVMPYGASFAMGNAVEIAAPIDTRTTDLRAGIEWTRPAGTVRVGYDGSWFDNHVPTLVWDNPLRLTDIATAGAQGRMPLWPSNSAQGVTAAGSLKLPAHGRATANVTVSRFLQDQELVPVTINSAVPAVPLPRATTEGDARALAMNYTVTARPGRYVWVNARYRFYELDNRTPAFIAERFVTMDQAARPMVHGTDAYGYTRHNLDVDASLVPTTFSAIRVGYGRAVDDRTFRIFGRTTENVVRTSVDATAGVVTVRGILEHAERRGSEFRPDLLAEVNEQPAMRHYDVADRDRNRATALIQLSPGPAIGLSASVAAGKDDYMNSGFGLRDNENRSYTISLDSMPREEVLAGVSYTRERYQALQRSRTASPGVQFVDPTRDWSLDNTDTVDTATGSLDLLKLVPKTELRFAYTFSRSHATYVHSVPAASTIPAPVRLPPVRNELHTGTADLRYFVTSKLAIGVLYWNDRYLVDDFALGSSTISRLDMPSALFLGSVFRPYTANSGSLRLLYSW